MENQIVEQDYFADGCRHAIVQHHTHGRIYLREMKNLEGDNFGWWHQGFAASIKESDTLESLGEIDGDVTVAQRVLAGYDPERPLMDWPGYIIKSVAESAGL